LEHIISELLSNPILVDVSLIIDEAGIALTSLLFFDLEGLLLDEGSDRLVQNVTVDLLYLVDMRTIDSGKLELLQIFFKFIFIVLDQVQIVVACREDLPISLTAFLVTIELLLGLIVAAVSISTDWSFFSRDHLLLLLVILKGDLNSTQVVHHL